MNKWVKLILISLFLLSLDSALKYFVQKNVPRMEEHFYPYGGIGVFENFFGISLSLNYVENKGAAWGSFANYSTLLFYARVFIVLGLIVYLILANLTFKKLFPYWLVITGAIGNILDYIFYGHVVDMIHFVFGSYSFAVFNLADAMISAGILLLIIESFPSFKKRKA